MWLIKLRDMSKGITIKKRTLNMIIIAIIVIAAVGILSSQFLFNSKGQTKTNSSENAALVNGEPITVQELNSYYDSLTSQQKQQVTKSQLLENLIQNELLKQKAKESDIKVNESEVNAQIQQLEMMASLQGGTLDELLSQRGMTKEEFKETIRERIMIQAYLNETLNINVSEKEIENYYENNKNQFVIPSQVNASHILVNTSQKAKEILNKLDNMTFAHAAEDYSTGPSASNGGNLGLFSKEQMVDNFSDVAFDLQIGEVSDIVRTQFGYHIIKVFDKKPKRNQTLEDSKEQIRNTLLGQKQTQAVQLLLRQLTSKADIQKFI